METELMYTNEQLALINKARKVIKRHTGMHLTKGEVYGALHIAAINGPVQKELLDSLNDMFNEYLWEQE